MKCGIYIIINEVEKSSTSNTRSRYATDNDIDLPI